MDDFPTPASLFGVGLLGMLLLAIGVALDGGRVLMPSRGRLGEYVVSDYLRARRGRRRRAS